MPVAARCLVKKSNLRGNRYLQGTPDNLGVILALAKCVAACPVLVAVCRRVCALSVGGDFFVRMGTS